MENSKKEEPVYTYIEKQPKIDSSKLNSHSSRSLESKETEMVSVTSSPDNENSLTEGFTEIVISDSKEDKSTNKNPIKPQMFTLSPFASIRRGNMIMLWFDDNLNPRIVIGPHWPFTLCLSIFITGICGLFYIGLWNKLNVYIRLFGIITYLVQIISFLTTALMNPGIPEKEFWLENYDQDKAQLTNYRICPVCQIVMNLDDHTEHCEDCNICIEGNDHHCPWTSKCVGKRNIKIFYLFTGSTFFLLFYLMFSLFSIGIFKTVEQSQ